MVIDRSRARHRLSKLLLRHGRVWRDGWGWTTKHEDWIAGQHFSERAAETTLAHHRATLAARDAAIAAIDADLAPWFLRPLPTPSGASARIADGSVRSPWRPRSAKAPVPDGRLLRRLLWPRADGALERHPHLAGRDHPRRQRPPAHPARGVRMVLQGPSRCRACAPPAPRGSRSRGRRPRLARAAPPRGRFRRLDARKPNRRTVVTAVARELAGLVASPFASSRRTVEPLLVRRLTLPGDPRSSRHPGVKTVRPRSRSGRGNLTPGAPSPAHRHPAPNSRVRRAPNRRATTP
jgi:hypothetical protein